MTTQQMKKRALRAAMYKAQSNYVEAFSWVSGSERGCGAYYGVAGPRRVQVIVRRTDMPIGSAGSFLANQTAPTAAQAWALVLAELGA